MPLKAHRGVVDGPGALTEFALIGFAQIGELPLPAPGAGGLAAIAATGEGTNRYASENAPAALRELSESTRFFASQENSHEHRSPDDTDNHAKDIQKDKNGAACRPSRGNGGS